MNIVFLLAANNLLRQKLWNIKYDVWFISLLTLFGLYFPFLLHTGNEEEMLLCDGCDRGFHMSCLKPALKRIPQGDWYCKDCRPMEVKRRSRKVSICNEEVETEEEEEEEIETEEEDEEDDGDSDDENDDEESDDGDEDEEDSEEDSESGQWEKF